VPKEPGNGERLDPSQMSDAEFISLVKKGFKNLLKREREPITEPISDDEFLSLLRKTAGNLKKRAAVRNCEDCKHCRLNPDAQEPYMEQGRVPVSPLTGKLLKQMAEESFSSEGCCMCFSIRSFSKLSPEEQLRFLERSQAED
jgi:hypothetical protein